MKKIFVICAALVFAAVACEKNNVEETAVKPEGNVPVKIFADMTVLEGADTKVDFVNPSGGNYALKWEVGDIIYVYNKVADYTTDPLEMNNLNRVAYEVTAVDALTGRATFKAEGGVDFESIFDTANDTFYASMGGEPNGTWHSNFLFAENVIQSSLSADGINVPAGRLDKKSFLAVSKAKLSVDGTLTFRFHPVWGYFKITIPENCKANVGSVKFYPYTSTTPRLSGFYQATLNEDGTFKSGERTNGAAAGGSANIIFRHREAGDTENSLFPAGSYYFPMMPGNAIRAARCYPTLDGSGSAFIGITGLNLAAPQGKVIDLGTLPTK